MTIASVETTPGRLGAGVLVLLVAGLSAVAAYDHFPAGLLRPDPAASAQADVIKAIEKVEADLVASVKPDVVAAIEKVEAALKDLKPVAPVVPAPVGPVQPIPPAPADPESLASAANSYYRTLPSVYHLVAQQVRTRQVKDERGLRDALGSHSLGLVAALERMIVASCDKNDGTINDPDGLAAMLDGAYAAMGGK